MFAIIRKCYPLVVGAATLTAPLFITCSALAQTAVIRVDGQNGAASPAGFGNGWQSNAYLFLSDATARAQTLFGGQNPPSNVEIRVRGANTSTGIVYRPDQSAANQGGSNARGATFTPRANVDIIGQWVGGTGGNADTQDPPYLTVLSGDIGTANDYSDNSFHIVTADDSGLDDGDVVQGFTITKGNGDGTSGSTPGGAGVIISNGAAPRFDRCTITANHANVTNGWGAGVHSTAASPVFTRSTISDNQGDTGFGSNHGGGVVVTGAPGVVRLIDCHITGNQSTDGGGISVKQSGEILVVNCLITGNTARQIGGGIAIDMLGTATVINTTIAGNTSVEGGGVAQWSEQSNASVFRNVIIWGNTATANGPEIWTDFAPGSMTIDYSDVRDRNGSGVVDPTDAIVWVTVGSPAVETNIGENVTAHDPDFIGGGNYRLTCGSPCINTGNPTSTIIPPDDFDFDIDEDTSEATPDLDLHHRVVGSVGSLRVDMGAYEKQPASGTCPGDVDGSCTVDVDDLVGVILAWGACSGCAADSAPAPCGNGQVDVDDLIAVILGWGPCEGGCLATGTAAGANPESYEDCEDICASLSGDAWNTCMQGCFMRLCANGQTAFCDD